MQLKVINVRPMGFPDRLAGKVVEAERHLEGYRLTDRSNNHLIVTTRWMQEGHAELVKEQEDTIAQAHASIYGVPAP